MIYKAILEKKEYIITLSHTEIDDLLMNVSFIYILINNYTINSIIFAWHLRLRLLQDTFEKDIYLIEIKNNKLKAQQDSLQDLDLSETTLLNEITIYEEKKVISKITRVVRSFLNL